MDGSFRCQHLFLIATFGRPTIRATTTNFLLIPLLSRIIAAGAALVIHPSLQSRLVQSGGPVLEILLSILVPKRKGVSLSVIEFFAELPWFASIS
jgi:hypothetical protein